MHFLVRLYCVCLAVVSVCGFLAVSPPEALAQNITFTNIADTSTFKFFETVPVVNSAGTVAFTGAPKGTIGTGLYTAANSDAIHLIVKTGSVFSLLGVNGINDTGTVAFFAVVRSGGNGFCTVTNGNIQLVALSPTLEFPILGGTSRINSAGIVAFCNSGVADTIYRSRGNTDNADAPKVDRVITATNPEFKNFGGSVGINSAGTVAFYAARNAGGEGVYTATTADAFHTVATTDSPEFSGFKTTKSNFFSAPSINDKGNVAFFATRDAGGEGIYTATDTKGFSTIATTENSEFTRFSTYSNPCINNAGTVVFFATRKEGGSGVYVKLAYLAIVNCVVVEGAIFWRGETPFPRLTPAHC